MVILAKSELIHIIIYQLKNYWIFIKWQYLVIKSAVNKNKNNYYYNIFLGKGSYIDKSDKQYF